jgi:transketolase
MPELIATRDAYGEALVECAQEFKNLVVLDADLSNATKTDLFKNAYPERFFDMGISEADMMGTAAGMAACGIIPFATSFAVFAAGRAFEQVRNAIAYPKKNVKIGATHAGVSVGADGASHQAVEDLAIMRAVPNMLVLSPADAVETHACVRAAIEHQGPVYLRLGRLPVPVIFEKNSYKFTLGKGIVLKKGTDVSIVSTGNLLHFALEAAETLAQQGISAKVINIHTVKPFDQELVIASAKETGAIVTLEEGTVLGGLGSAVAETVTEEYPVPVKKMGLNDVFGQSGKAEELLEYYGLSTENIIRNVHKAVKMKK